MTEAEALRQIGGLLREAKLALLVGNAPGALDLIEEAKITQGTAAMEAAGLLPSGGSS